jgi:hypothetical protein
MRENDWFLVYSYFISVFYTVQMRLSRDNSTVAMSYSFRPFYKFFYSSRDNLNKLNF